MRHKAYVGFINPHAEGDRRHHHLNVIPLKIPLYLFPQAIFHARMIRRCSHTFVAQGFRNTLYFVAAVAIHNATFAFLCHHEAAKLFHRLKFFHQGVANIRAIETAHMKVRSI